MQNLIAVWLGEVTKSSKRWLRCFHALGILDGVVSGGGLGVIADFAVRHFAKLTAVEIAVPPLNEPVWMSASDPSRVWPMSGPS